MAQSSKSCFCTLKKRYPRNVCLYQFDYGLIIFFSLVVELNWLFWRKWSLFRLNSPEMYFLLKYRQKSIYLLSSPENRLCFWKLKIYLIRLQILPTFCHRVSNSVLPQTLLIACALSDTFYFGENQVLPWLIKQSWPLLWIVFIYRVSLLIDNLKREILIWHGKKSFTCIVTPNGFNVLDSEGA